MSNQSIQAKPSSRSCPRRAHQSLGLFALLNLIVQHSDRGALAELHDYRRVFWHADDGPLLLAEFLDRLRNGPLTQHYAGPATHLHDASYDLTLDKFTHFPPSSLESGRGNGDRYGEGTDCRRYLGVVMGMVSKWHDRHPAADALDLELRTANQLQRAVVWNHYRSCREVRRQDRRGRSRYDYAHDGMVLHLWMPTHLAGYGRRIALESLVPDLDSHRPGEQQRVQAIIDLRYGSCRHVPLSDSLEATATNTALDNGTDCVEQAVDALGLAEVVAREKVIRLGDQRSSIRKLGAARVRQLILRRFELLTQGKPADPDCDGELAREFGLSPSSFSRFCGSRRLPAKGKRRAVELGDLWANTAEVVANHRRFMQAAQDSGVWQRITELYPTHKKEADHGP